MSDNRRMLDFLITSDCHGSGRCVKVAPAHFVLDPVDGQSRIIEQPENSEEMAICDEALRICPVNAIRSIPRGAQTQPELSEATRRISLRAFDGTSPVDAICIDHVNMFVSDLEESVEFYSILLGITVKERGVGKGNIRWAILGHPSRFYLCFYELQGAVFEPDALHINHVGFHVANFDETIQQLREFGLKLEYGDEPVNWGTSRSAYIRDPNGYAVEFVEKFGGGIG